MASVTTYWLTLVSASSILLAGCGGSGNSSDDDTGQGDQTTTQTGVFVDSAVGNVDYETSSGESGTTNADGEFQFVEGDTVTFSIGDLTFPGTAARETITPLELAGTTDPNNRQVVNIARLLQTLDTDGDPDNGITISDLAKDNATAINFDQSAAEFENDTAVTTLVTNGGQDSAPAGLVSTEEALAHLNDTLEEVGSPTLTGTWLVSASAEDENDLLAFTFFPDGTYVHMEIDQDDPDEDSGMEWGNFLRNAETGEMTVDQEYLDNNGDTGLTDFANNPGSLAASYDATTLTLSFDDNLDGTMDGSISFDRLETDGIVGTWMAPEENENDLLFFIFFEDGTYLHLEVDEDDTEEVSGMEWGTFEVDSGTGEATIAISFEGNGDTGLTDFAYDFEDLYPSLEGDELTLGIDVDQDGNVDDTIVFSRL